MYDGGNWGVLDLNEDPVQGDPANVRALATFSKNESGFWSEHTETLTTTADFGSSMPMQGDFAPKYRDHLNELPGRAAALRDAHEKTGTALGQYAELLEEAKGESRQALSQGMQAKQQYQQAQRANNQAIQEMNQIVAGGPYPPEVYPQAVAQWEQAQARSQQAQMFMQEAEQMRLAAKERAMMAGQNARQAENSAAQQVRGATSDSIAAKGGDVNPFGPGVGGGIIGAGGVIGADGVIGGGGPTGGPQGQGPAGGHWGDPAGLSDALVKTNPNFGAGRQWKENCPNCVQAFELRRRGLDVEAAPLTGGGSSAWAEKTWGRGFTDVSDSPGGSRAALDQAFQQFGPGSRGVVRAIYGNGASHVFSVENLNNELRYVCSQQHLEDATRFFRNVDQVAYVRLDDLPMPNLNGPISKHIIVK